MAQTPVPPSPPTSTPVASTPAAARGPRCGVGAAFIRDGRILLVQRLKAPEALHWGLPGGKIDWMESVEPALIREVAEELAVTIANLDLLCMAELVEPQTGEHWVAPVYLVGRWDGEPRNVEPDTHGAVAWYPLDALPERVTRATRAAIAAYHRRQG